MKVRVIRLGTKVGTQEHYRVAKLGSRFIGWEIVDFIWAENDEEAIAKAKRLVTPIEFET